MENTGSSIKIFVTVLKLRLLSPPEVWVGAVLALEPVSGELFGRVDPEDTSVAADEVETDVVMKPLDTMALACTIKPDVVNIVEAV
ncbi:hypothetical protein ACEPAI_2434 [Sanghuangporus weigelae]